MESTLQQLKRVVNTTRTTMLERQQLNQLIADNVFVTSQHLRKANFESLHASDIQLLYELYDENYFRGLLRSTLSSKLMSFRLSKRMTRAGGKTTRWKDPRGKRPPRYEIAVATTLLFQSFQDPERPVTVTGIECVSRLDGLMRVMEHELVHLIELLIWSGSSCSMRRFQDITARMFGHTHHQHELLTPSEVAVREYGIRPGSRVRFDLEGHHHEGIVNRITKRATVLVIDPRGQPYSDGYRYVKFYVPLRLLEPVD
ncbi:MAG TPA: SprT-like family protein [Planctomycetes bacterium]|nr:SprT-like family protein [Fuerstiella sp.]HIK90656.1 SprT-like family protein [Planctomycetota bacterium]